MGVAWLLPAVLLIFAPGSEATHHGCNASTSDPNSWSCDYQLWPRKPLQMWWQNLSDFTSPIKTLHIYNIDFEISSRMFRNLSSYQPVDDSQSLGNYLTNGNAAIGGSITSLFNSSGIFIDQNSEPELILECSKTATWPYLVLYNDSFVGLEWMKRITIIGCHLAGFNTGAFKLFTNITSFSVLGGVFNDMSFNAMQGMGMSATDVVGSGVVEITAEFPFNFLFFYMIDPLKGAHSLTIKGNKMNRAQTSLVSAFTEMSSLDLSYNEYYFLPETMLEGLDRLASFRVLGIKWFCYCTGTWLFQWQEERNAQLEGEFICEFPSAYKGQRLYDFRSNECNTTKYYGVDIDGQFVEATDWLLLGGMFLILLFCLIAIILAVKTIQFKKNPFNTTKGTGRRKPPKVETKGRKQGWKT